MDAPHGSEPSSRHRAVLDVVSSFQFWLVVAYVILAIVVVWLYVVGGQRRRDEALHRGEVIADARSKENQCLQTRPVTAKIDSFVYAVLRFHVAAWENAKATSEATPRSDPQYEVRKRNAERIRQTIAPVAAISFPVPTVAQCLLIGHTRYGVVPPTVPVMKVRVPSPPSIPDDAFAPGRPK